MSGSWWATVWSSAVETEAFTDTSQLESGRRLLRRRQFSAPQIEPGSAVLRTAEWVAQLGVARLDDDRWETLCGLVAVDTMVAAAVLSGEVPVELHGRALTSGISLAPGAGQLVADCTCPDWHEPCAHVAALCALITDQIEVDPWTLLLLLGRGRHEIIERVRALRNEARGRGRDEAGDQVRGADPGVAAAAAFKRTIAPLPAARPILRRPMPPVTITVDPPADAGISARDLRRLVDDASDRAIGLLNGEESSGLHLIERHDLARLADRAVGEDDDALRVLADRVGISIEELEVLGRAWAIGRSAGVAVLDERFEADRELTDRAQQILGPGARVRSNQVTLGEVQLRVDRNNRWWRFDAHPRLGWVPTSVLGRELDPEELSVDP